MLCLQVHTKISRVYREIMRSGKVSGACLQVSVLVALSPLLNKITHEHKHDRTTRKSLTHMPERLFNLFFKVLSTRPRELVDNTLADQLGITRPAQRCCCLGAEKTFAKLQPGAQVTPAEVCQCLAALLRHNSTHTFFCSSELHFPTSKCFQVVFVTLPKGSDTFSLHKLGSSRDSRLILEAWPEQFQSAGTGGNPTEQVSLCPEAALLLTLGAITLKP